MTKNNHQDVMQRFARAVSDIFPDMGFVFLLFDFGDSGIADYISNAQRPDMINALREAANRLERNQVIGTGQEN